jgi:hypothetical protein
MYGSECGTWSGVYTATWMLYVGPDDNAINDMLYEGLSEHHDPCCSGTVLGWTFYHTNHDTSELEEVLAL